MEMWVRGPLDYLHYYLSGELFERIALDNAMASSIQLREVFFVEDLVVAQITKNILSPIKHAEPLDRLALDQIAMAWRHVLQAHCGAPKFTAGSKRGLEAPSFYPEFRRLEHITPSHWRRANSKGAAASETTRPIRCTAF